MTSQLVMGIQCGFFHFLGKLEKKTIHFSYLGRYLDIYIFYEFVTCEKINTAKWLSIFREHAKGY